MNKTAVKTIASALGIVAVGAILQQRAEQTVENEMPRLKIIKVNLSAETKCDPQGVKLQKRNKNELTVEQILSNNF
jgi:hypothetical protein